MNDGLSLIGELTVVINRADGSVVEDDYKNLVVTAGKVVITSSAFFGASATNFGFIAVGSGATAPAIGQTTLVAETGRVATVNTGSGTNIAQLVATFGAGVATGSIQEAAIFSAASAGTMLSRVLIGPYTKAAGDTITITWTVTVG